MDKNYLLAHTNLGRWDKIICTEVFVVHISSTKDGVNPEEDSELLSNISEFRKNNRHIDILDTVFNGPDSEGYENYAYLYCTFYSWYKEKLIEIQKGK